MSRICWLDCSSGVSGDMLLGALSDAGALTALPRLVESLSSLGVDLDVTPTERAGLAAVAVTVTAAGGQPHRRLREVREIVDSAAVDDEVRSRALAIFERLAAAEAAVHGISIDEVEFHEVGAVDSVVDVLGACLGLHALGADRLIVSPIAVGGGSVTTQHGELPVPTPAALALLAGSQLVGVGGGETELATPTGLAVLAEWADQSGPMPLMRIESVGVGAGSRNPADRPNVVRLVVGDAAVEEPDEEWLVVEANIDDLDPRLWPGVLSALMEAGAADAWLTPILMKKGRPAHTVSALTPAESLGAVQGAMFTHTSTIGLRWNPVGKHALARETITVEVQGQQVRVKVAFAEGKPVSATPEFDDIAAAAAALGVPTKHMLEAAVAGVRNAWTGAMPPA
ncbi:MAG TPA: nickel pincer cofactor biosynthesis protein LarC [Mycobacteriales bacterium]|nr:nickel pincer cofactor biosynthesis protein LarC [Mycobacteriales bacterium]